MSVTAGLRLTGLAAAGGHTCGQGSDGRLYCWGRNVARQFGDGMTSIPTPVAMPAVAGIQLSEIVAGNAHTCAMGSNGRPYCWGDNVWGQLGDGTTVNRGTPKPVVATY